jgi:hypothetical protein
LGMHHIETANNLNNLGLLYGKQGKYEQAEPLFTRVLAIYEQILISNHPSVANTLHEFARFSEGQSNLQKTASLYGRALTIREKVYGLEHPKTTDTRERLHAVLDRMEGITIPSTKHPEQGE